jgi:hypothetical protein
MALAIGVTVGAALLALWLDVRWPRLAPDGPFRRVAFALGTAALLQLLRGAGPAATPASVLAVVLPAFVAAFLAGIWLLRALREL